MQFLLDLLQDSTKRNIIEWRSREERIFEIVDVNILASQWGAMKNNSNMNYRKMSRALRMYYPNPAQKKVGMLRKFKGNRSKYCYQ